MAGYGDRRLGEFLDLVAARESAPGGGSVAAVTVSLAASLVAMAARFSSFPGAEEMAERADQLRREAAALADADATAYGAVLAERTAASGDDAPKSGERMQRLLLRASEIPREVTTIGAEVSQAAARLVLDGNPNLRGDAATALLLAEAGVRSAAGLIRLNLAGLADDDGADLVHGADLAAQAAADARRTAEL